MPLRIIVDPLPQASRVAVLRDDRLIAYFADEGHDAAPAPGAVVVARVDRVFPGRRLIACDLGGIAASLRWQKGAMPKPGQRLIATVAADAREDKPLQLRHGVVIEDPLMVLETAASGGLRLSRRLAATGFVAPAGLADLCTGLQLTLRQRAAGEDGEVLITRAKTMISEARQLEAMAEASPGVIRTAPDAAETARLAFPEAAVCRDDDGVVWQDADIDSMITAALSPRQLITGGAVLHINTPPGAAVIDGDSGSSDLPPLDLARAMVTPVAEAVLLRRISGPVVVDFPRLEAAGQKAVHAAMELATADDPLRPQCHGFARGGLYTMTRPWRWQPLAGLLAPTPRFQAVEAVRLARRMAATPAAGVVTLSPEARDWITGPGAAWVDDVLKGLASLIEFRSDEGCTEPRFTRR
ncbi:MAG: ribonuclease E/G [Candidatus Puniceispirillales bacterium]